MAALASSAGCEDAPFGPRVADRDGGHLSPLRAVFRPPRKQLELSPGVTARLIAAFIPRHQALHDTPAGTYVVRISSVADTARVRPCPC